MSVSQLRPSALLCQPVHGLVAVSAAGVSFAFFGGAKLAWVNADAGIWHGQLWRLVTSTLMHINVVHLAFNLYWFVALGVKLERWLGWRRAGLLFLLLAVGSSAAEFVWTGTGGVGLSGVVYGYVGLILGSQGRGRSAGIRLSANTLSLFVFWFFLCIVLTKTGLWSVGNVAHAAGAAIGYLAARAINVASKPGACLGAIILVVVALMLATLYMPWNYRWWWDRAYAAATQEDHHRALEACIQTVEHAPDDQTVAEVFPWAASLAFNLNDTARARNLYRRAKPVSTDPKLMQAYIAYSHWYEGNSEAAMEASAGLSAEHLDPFLSGVAEFVRLIEAGNRSDADVPTTASRPSGSTGPDP